MIVKTVQASGLGDFLPACFFFFCICNAVLISHVKNKIK